MLYGSISRDFKLGFMCKSDEPFESSQKRHWLVKCNESSSIISPTPTLDTRRREKSGKDSAKILIFRKRSIAHHHRGNISQFAT